jgi:SET domain-containing protein
MELEDLPAHLRESVLFMKSLSVVQPSWLNGADQGLFARVPLRKGQVLGCYVGERLRTAQALKVKDKSYLMRIGEQKYIDSRRTLWSLARFINDCRNPSGHNVMFLKCVVDHCAWVITTCDIQRGEEIFVDYGRW